MYSVLGLPSGVRTRTVDLAVTVVRTGNPDGFTEFVGGHRMRFASSVPVSRGPGHLGYELGHGLSARQRLQRSRTRWLGSVGRAVSGRANRAMTLLPAVYQRLSALGLQSAFARP